MKKVISIGAISSLLISNLIASNLQYNVGDSYSSWTCAGIGTVSKAGENGFQVQCDDGRTYWKRQSNTIMSYTTSYTDNNYDNDNSSGNGIGDTLITVAAGLGAIYLLSEMTRDISKTNKNTSRYKINQYKDKCYLPGFDRNMPKIREGCYNLGMARLNENSMKNAKKAFWLGCLARDTKSCMYSGAFYEKEGKILDAVAFYHEACNYGDGEKEACTLAKNKGQKLKYILKNLVEKKLKYKQFSSKEKKFFGIKENNKYQYMLLKIEEIPVDRWGMGTIEQLFEKSGIDVNQEIIKLKR